MPARVYSLMYNDEIGEQSVELFEILNSNSNVTERSNKDQYCNAPRGVSNDPETSYSTKISKRVEALNYRRKQSTSQVAVIKQIVY